MRRKWILLSGMFVGAVCLYTSLKKGRFLGEHLTTVAYHAYYYTQYQKAYKLAYPPAFAGNAKAEYLLGMLSYGGLGTTKNHAWGINWWRKAAEDGYAPAQTMLGGAYASGADIPQDNTAAIEWYLKAAGQGWVEAENLLGMAYQMGKGTSQDYGKALEWYRKAAEQGSKNAQLRIGMMYFKGMGVPKDYVEAYAWIGLAESGTNLGIQGKPRRSNLEFVKAFMTPWQIAAAQRRFADYQKRIPTQQRQSLPD